MTDQRSCAFYLAWFNRLYVPSDHGWYNTRTPDGLPIMEQDAYFWRCLEILCAEFNQLLREAVASGGR